MFDIFQTLLILIIITFISIALLWTDRLLSRFFGSPNIGIIWGRSLKWKLVAAFILIIGFMYVEVRLKNNSFSGYDLGMELIIGFLSFITMSAIFFRDKFFLLMATKSGELMDKVDSGDLNPKDALKETYQDVKEGFGDIVESANEQIDDLKEYLPNAKKDEGDEVAEKPDTTTEDDALSPRERINKHLKN